MSNKGPYANYVDKILTIFPPPSSVDKFTQHLLWQTALPSLFYVVCVWPLLQFVKKIYNKQKEFCQPVGL